MKKLTPDFLSLNVYHRIMHLSVFLLGYFSASLFGVFILCYSIGGAFPEELYPHLLRFLELYIDWSTGFCLISTLLYLFVELVRCRFFPGSYDLENIFILRLITAILDKFKKQSL
ncbi:MAG: hypothetical protein D3914_00720 [Candidatus Electrothrix sp. LOE2]|nr:hypothetical protein [Candidatus Electrothrix sp. LOE2]